ncbi:MAG: RelA/SpoT family protein [Patescibacteria group bacterium]|nr:RelA/SpoT family protein [Patescibacteria group bacterium]
MTIEKVIETVKLKNQNIDEDFVMRAYEFAKKAHQGQKRKTGEDYIQHPLEIAYTLAKLGLGCKTLASALLHDVLEDTDYTLEQIKKEFGSEVTFIVKGLTKLDGIKLRGKEDEHYLENLRRMFLAMGADIRTIIVKLVDRYHNMLTLDALSPDKQYQIAKETMEIYAPIANRLGIGEIKGALEDLAFQYMDPKKYNEVDKMTKEKYKERMILINKIIKEIKKILGKEKIKIIDIHGRAKHLYRLYQKLKKHNMDIEEVYDLVAIRIIVPEIKDCYETLGIIHKHYRPLIKRIKDFISLPKPNGYRSLHTTVFTLQGDLIEIQIRNQEMHEEAEFGIAAHWIYSDEKVLHRFFPGHRKKRTKDLKKLKKELAWTKQLQSWQEEVGSDSEEFFKSLKIDFLENRIFAFTPDGDVIDLPEGATPIDFAYEVHTEIGNSAIGAKADDEAVPLNYTIQNGEVIKIITQKGKITPDSEWLEFVRTGRAKMKIREVLRKQKQAGF